MGADTFRAEYVASRLSSYCPPNALVPPCPLVPVATNDSANPGEIDDIPDLDGDGPDHDDSNISKDMSHLKLGSSSGAPVAAVPDMDDIPDMEEEGLEEAEDDAVQATE